LSLFPPHRPDFLIIGAQKAATTSLFSYLNLVPHVNGSKNKEIYFFDRDYNYEKGLDWYHQHFKSFSVSSKNRYFEATPNYLYYPWVAERIYNYNRDLKFIIVLREPVSRAYSAWNMYKGFFESGEFYRIKKGIRHGEENYIFKYLYKDRLQFPSFEECIDIEFDLIKNSPDILEPSLIRRGLYYEQIKRYTDIFPSSNMYFVGYKDLINNTPATISSICSFLHSNDKGIKLDYNLRPRNSREYKRGISVEMNNVLTAFYKQPNEMLFKQLGKTINW
jgi:hypothetical protein